MKRFDQINVIPFIDIMLVLLAIVLTTATFIAQGVLEIDVPEARNSEPLKPEQTRRIAIDAASQYYLDEQPVTLPQLEETLRQLPGETPILLQVDRQVTFDKFIAVIDLLKGGQLNNLSIVTRDPG